MATGEYLCQWPMDDLTTFLELPLDRELYKPKPIKCVKPPLRILITEGGSRAAHHLMYYICSGKVFGPDQKVIIHLINAKGLATHKGILLDIEECGFFALTGFVVSSNPKKSYRDVDVVILIAFFEELSGHTLTGSLVCQVTKARSVARKMRLYSKPDAKLIICSPSTKGVVVLLTCIRTCVPSIPIQNMSGVTLMDETIAKNLLAARLKVTTDKIKNLVIWGSTCADVHNATVFMYPPDDKGNVKKVDVPLLEVLDNHQWVFTDFKKALHRRLSNPDLATFGGGLATATARHLKFLFQGTDNQEEIVTMGAIAPSNEPYGFHQNYAFSLPVVTKDGKITIREDVHYETSTHLMNIKTVYRYHHDQSIKFIFKLLNYIEKYEHTTKEPFIWTEHTHLWKDVIDSIFVLKCIISPRKTEQVLLEKPDLVRKKSITWEEGPTLLREFYYPDPKSSLRFNV